MRVSVLDYGAGNVRSLHNALVALGCEVEYLSTAEQITAASALIFPGVGAFGRCMEVLEARGFTQALKAYVAAGRPYLGICLGLQTLFEGSEESPGVAGLGIIPGIVGRFASGEGRSVPQIGWNGLRPLREHGLLDAIAPDDAVYFVHSFRVAPDARLAEWPLCETDYGEPYVSAVAKGAVSACQFHPEKSGAVGLRLLGNFLRLALGAEPSLTPPPATRAAAPPGGKTRFCKRVIACMDVRANDSGDLVVTKGDQYDVREKSNGGEVRNLGKPVALAERYYHEGADEITFLNITGFRDCPLTDMPMTQLIAEASKNIFVPLTVGGGIRAFTDSNGVSSTALQVADAYFRAGADKVSIGSDAVDVARAWLEKKELTGTSSIEAISRVYGRQAVVVSIDPRRRWVKTSEEAEGHALCDHSEHRARGPEGETLCWYECTVQGGRAGSGLDVVQVSQAVQALGAGEILLNCIDNDGQNDGYDIPLVRSVRQAVGIPVIASSGAGSAAHFDEVFKQTGVEAALAASIFHRNQVSIREVKELLMSTGVDVRQV
ncbi:hypothetical protein AB1Y20_005915 [Prymnesium parvum]|uniref:Imidazole glycerol phosphate synthase hisHF n=1 Tax=Prymnesium parvum TaxID=97485 RepID=A0AB34J075_PRYPA